MTNMKYRGAFSGFSVPDIAKVRDFYINTLELNAVDTAEGLEIKLPQGGSAFVYTSADNKPADYTVLNLVVEDIDAAVDELVSKGVAMEQYDMGMVKTDAKGIARGSGDMGPRAIAWFKDPAGNILSVLQKS